MSVLSRVSQLLLIEGEPPPLEDSSLSPSVERLFFVYTPEMLSGIAFHSPVSESFSSRRTKLLLT